METAATKSHTLQGLRFSILLMSKTHQHTSWGSSKPLYVKRDMTTIGIGALADFVHQQFPQQDKLSRWDGSAPSDKTQRICKFLRGSIKFLCLKGPSLATTMTIMTVLPLPSLSSCAANPKLSHAATTQRKENRNGKNPY